MKNGTRLENPGETRSRPAAARGSPLGDAGDGADSRALPAGYLGAAGVPRDAVLQPSFSPSSHPAEACALPQTCLQRLRRFFS